MALERRGTIDAFWRWFGAHVAPRLRGDALPSDAVIATLDEGMRGLGLSWELGPAPEGSGWAFAVSFGADLERLPRARAVAEAAPRFETCVVLLGKPPKTWEGTVVLQSLGGDIEFATAKWPCAVLEVQGGVAVMTAPGPAHADLERVELAASIAVEGMLGELRVARRVRLVTVVDRATLDAAGGQRCLMEGLGDVVR